MAPDGWRSATLGALAQVNPEQLANRTDPDYLLEYLDIAAIEHPGAIGATRTLTFAEAPSRARRRVRAGDILVSTVRPYLRNFAQVREAPENLVASTGYAVVRPADGVDGRFLYQHVLSEDFVEFLKPRMTGSNYPAVKGDDVEAYTLSCPPLPEQRKIAAILSSVDDALEKSQAVIDQVQVVKRGLMQDLLTRGLPGRHTRFQQTEIGEIPEGWDVQPAATVCERIVVGIVIKPSQYYTPSGVPCLRSLNVQEDQISYREMNYISNASNEKLMKSQLRTGDVITVRTGYPGTSAVVPASLAGANCVDLIISTPGPRIRGAFLSRFVNSERGRAAVAQKKSGLAQQHFNVGALKAMLVPIPCLQEQDEICDALEAADERIKDGSGVLEGLVSLKSALMSVLLTGEIRVSPDAAAA